MEYKNKLIVDLTDEQFKTKTKILESGHGNIKRLISALLDQVGEILEDDSITPSMLIALLESKQFTVRNLLRIKEG